MFYQNRTFQNQKYIKNQLDKNYRCNMFENKSSNYTKERVRLVKGGTRQQEINLINKMNN